MIRHSATNPKNLFHQIKNKNILLAGNSRMKIFGRLNCSSGKRLNIQSRVFFSSINEAIAEGFRPCGHCFVNQYRQWKRQVEE